MHQFLEGRMARPFFGKRFRQHAIALLLATVVTGSALAAPVIDPIASAIIPAGKSLILPITATSLSGPLTYTVASSTHGIAALLHTNNLFWQLSVAQVAATNAPGAYSTPFRGGTATVTNLGTLTFMLFPEYAPHTINVFQGLTTSGFFNSNTIFHRVMTNEFIQGGDPLTNGLGGLVFTYDDEYNPEAIFSGNGQLALANAQKNANGSQFFITYGAQRGFDFRYPLFGQLLRGFDVLTNVVNTSVDTNSRPLAEVIIQQADYVSDPTDTVLTLTATNVAGVNGTITIIATDSAGGRATNTFAASTVADTNSNNNAIIYPNTVAKLVGPKNVTLTNSITALELDDEPLNWFLYPADQATYYAVSNTVYYNFTNVFKTLTYNVRNADGGMNLLLRPSSNYVGAVTLYFYVSFSADWGLYQEYGLPLPNYDEQVYTFVFGDTPVSGQSNLVAALASVPFTNALLATFTNGVPDSPGANFTAAINWGDDTTNSGSITVNAAGQKAVLGSHTYAYPGSYPVYVQVQSVLGASDTILSFVNVTNQATPATNLLTVLVSGPGTVSPGYTNAPLAVGASYTISAMPSNNFCFLESWTDNHGFVLGTGTNLTFTMSPGLSLTANFALITPPSLAFVAPVAGQVLTNLYSAPATISGTASNTATVAAVWYQANSGGWQTASGTTSWTADFMPAYGVTNVIQAYAVNNFGYVSATNILHVKYLAGDILRVATNGLGRIAPNLNDQLLALGTNYALTATPAAGFIVTNWTISTNWLGGRVTNSATVQFAMATNLTLQVNFKEVARPTNTLTAPANGQHMTNALATLAGTAKDLWQVTGVWYQLNNGTWQLSATANGWTNWSTTLPLQAGTNVLKTYAVNMGGNFSTTNSVSVVSSNTFLLQLAFPNPMPLKTNGLAFTLRLSHGLDGLILVSPDLINWYELTNFTGTNATLSFSDPGATNSSHRFYRAVIP